MASQAKAAGMMFGFGVLVMMVGLFLLPLSGAANVDTQRSVILEDGQSDDTLHQNLEVELSENADSVNVSVTDTKNADRSTLTLNETETGTVSLTGGNVTAEYVYSLGGGEHSLRLTYDPTFGFNESAQLFYSNLDLLITLVGLIIALSGVVMGVKLA